MRTSVKLSEKSDAASVLELPKGRLMVGELVADFSPENVVDAARNIITACSHDYDEHTFFTQAGVIEHSANRQSWNNRPEYKAI